jgi:hypothetical protein
MLQSITGDLFETEEIKSLPEAKLDQGDLVTVLGGERELAALLKRAGHKGAKPMETKFLNYLTGVSDEPSFDYVGGSRRWWPVFLLCAK